jgi:hypothetical protein
MMIMNEDKNTTGESGDGMIAEKEECGLCNRRFSTHLLQPMTISNGTGTRTVRCCPICALAEINRLHGLPHDTPFRGEVAQLLYTQAMKELKAGKDGKK